MKKEKTSKQQVKIKTNKEKIISVLKMFFKTLAITIGSVLLIIVLFFVYINLPAKVKNNDAQIGVTFSSLYAQQIGLDWKAAYLAMLDDLQLKHVRLPVYWDRVEKVEGQYDFSDIDWQLEQAQSRNVKIILVVGQKVPRWPECYVPKWVGEDPSNLDQIILKEKLLAFEDVVIRRYKDNHPEIDRWQVENEPFLDFGICSKVNPDLLDSEIAQVRSLDTTRPIVVTDSGELSLWLNVAKRADIFGTTMYREVYSAKMGHWRYPIGPNFFKAKQLFIKLFAKQNNAIVIELQGEPWVAGWTTDAPVETQLASMNSTILLDNVEFAKKTGMKEIYVWGVEWWYWMKATQNNSTLWEAAKTFNK
ncbi:MAG: hypothetical protein WCI36_00250 [bacterium]